MHQSVYDILLRMREGDFDIDYEEIRKVFIIIIIITSIIIIIIIITIFDIYYEEVRKVTTSLSSSS